MNTPQAEPSILEITVTLILGLLLGRAVYGRYVDALPLAPSDRVLDFGSGPGLCARFLARRLASKSGSVTCLDISPRWHRVAKQVLRQTHIVRIVLADPGKIPFPDASFSAVICHFVLHDLPPDERDATVASWHRVLVPGGAVFLREPVGQHGLPPDELRRHLMHGKFREVSSSLEPVPLMGTAFRAHFISEPAV